MSKRETIRFTTGCKLLDLVTGGAKGDYGFPVGRFINIVGDKSAGKTFLANEIIASAYYTYGSKKFKWVYDDCESGYSFDTKEMYGFEIMPVEKSDRVHSTTVEEAFCNICNFADSLKDGQFGIYVVDSLDGLTSDEQNEQADARLKSFKNGKIYDKGSYNAGKPRYLSREFFPQLCSKIEDKNVLVIIISQVRENMDMFSFEKFKRNGGKALDFYSYMVLWLATAKKFKKKNRAVGVCVKAKVTKGKVRRPYRECFFNLDYGYGLDDTATSIDFLFDLKTDGGDLNSQAKAVRWQDGKKISVNSLKSWMKDENILDSFTESDFKISDKIKVDEVLDWVNSNDEIKEKFDSCFGVSMTRDELIMYIEDNNLKEELSKRVEEKWEEIEDSLLTSRRKKYATQPVEQSE